MKNILPFLALAALGTTLQSCVKDEALNAEADITQASVHVGNPDHYFYQQSDSVVHVPYSDSTVTFTVRPTADLTALAPRFTLTEGATISPENGSVHDFSQGGVRYTVRSADGAWTRTYLVRFALRQNTVRDTLEYDFEHYELNAQNRYYLWTEEEADGTKTYPWATGNPGYNLSMGSAPAMAYPSTPDENGYEGKCVKLTTSDTGPLGRLVNRRIAAGNLFWGTFDLQQALFNSLAATKFGLPTNNLPLRFSAYYRYAPAANYQDQQGNIVADMKDEAHIYAVLYRNHDEQGNAVTLDGTNVLTSPLIVGIASLDHIGATSEWTKMDIPFVYTQTVDEALLAQYGYSLAIVFSSSREGALFRGAIGSTLWVDKVRISCSSSQ